VETGVGERLQREAMRHDGIFLCFEGALHHLDFRSLVGKGIAIYGQQEIVKDLIARRLADGGEIFFEVEDVRLHGFDSGRPTITFQHEGAEKEISCDFIGGCDGSRGICRPSFPPGSLTAYERGYPFAWLGILAEAPPPERELIYAFHARGFALCSMRSPTVSRLYLQCAPDEDLKEWPDDRIWQELRTRLDGTRALTIGKILQKGITPMRSFVAEPMQHGRLFLAGDAAHIVPPTGAKGMNLALADVLVLSRAIHTFYASGRSDRLDAYSATCLRRVWKAQRFSLWMTQLLHRFTFERDFDYRRQLAELDYVTNSRAAATALAENYVGLPLD
jgi:p-hydroxybenzoate 3-monooxygenase